jgi:hypothetical protein
VPPRVLVLPASVGACHLRAARTVELALLERILAAVVVVSEPGGLTTSEALACGPRLRRRKSRLVAK